jgi:hypothetical protein
MNDPDETLMLELRSGSRAAFESYSRATRNLLELAKEWLDGNSNRQRRPL